ncbi:MAG: hypothetical protein PF694_09860 [Bacteroidetes bacterium]|jgi:hypothetical protein|nr:hypothetical protein [Bacteroidota bacterium]
MRKLQLLLILIVFLTASCKKDREVPVQPLPDSMEQLNVPADFDWKTTREYNFTFTSSSDGIVTVVSQNGTVFHKAMLSAGQELSVKLSLPAYLENIQVKQLGRIVERELNQNSIEINFQ